MISFNKRIVYFLKMNSKGVNDKQILIKLIKENDPSISYQNFHSKSSLNRGFKRVLIDNESTDYVKCDEFQNLFLGMGRNRDPDRDPGQDWDGTGIHFQASGWDGTSR